MQRRIAFSIFFFVAFLGTNAAAESPSLASSYDMGLPASSVGDCDGSLSILYNPAGLAFGPRTEGTFLFGGLQNETNSSVYASGMLLKIGGLGLGVQYLRPSGDDRSWDYLKYSVGFPLIRVGSVFSFGAGLEWLDPTENSGNVSMDWLLGMMVRPMRYLSIGLVGRNLNQSGLFGERASRSLDIGVSARPLWFAPERATFSIDARWKEDAGTPPLRFTGQVAVLQGLSVFGTADLDGNFGGGLMVDFQRSGIGGYVGARNRDSLEMDNVVTWIRFTQDEHPALVSPRKKTAEFVLSREIASQDEPRVSFFERKKTLFDVETSIRRAAIDDSVDSVLLRIQDPELSMTKAQELRDALQAVKQRGKKVICHIQEPDNLRYYLASVADAIFLEPGSSLMLGGPKVQAIFIKGTLDLVGVRVEYERVGKYKSAVEQLANEAPSDSYREVLNSLADEAFEQFVEAIADGRHLERGKVLELLDRAIFSAGAAKKTGLIDAVVREDQLDASLKKTLGHGAWRADNYLHQEVENNQWGLSPGIAVVHMKGGIGYRGGFGESIEARRFVDLLSSLRDDPGIDAVVLRVDSPGGSGFASDLIWREVKRLRERKPVVVSMSGVAASGGYYISCPADVIVADPATITGSIGVFAMFFDLSELYKKIGITQEMFKRSQHADVESTFRGRTPEEMEMIKKAIEQFYRGFVKKVAQGRKLSVEQVDGLGQGRVWTGRQAKQRGLVDELGGLSRAIAIAKERSGVAQGERVRIVHLPRPEFSIKRIFEDMVGSEKSMEWPVNLQEPLDVLMWAAQLSQEPVAAALPFVVQIR
jgi:protease IV